MALIETLATDIDALSLLSEAMNFDFSTKGLDEAFTDAELASISGTQSMRDRVVRASGKTNPTVRDFIISPAAPGPTRRSSVARRKWPTGWSRCSPRRPATGSCWQRRTSPARIWISSAIVVPELQRRRLYHQDYAGKTLRENLGLERPRRGYWHARAPAIAQSA